MPPGSPAKTMLLQLHFSGDDDETQLDVQIIPAVQSGYRTTYASEPGEQRRIFDFLESISVNVEISDEGIVTPLGSNAHRSLRLRQRPDSLFPYQAVPAPAHSCILSFIIVTLYAAIFGVIMVITILQPSMAYENTDLLLDNSQDYI